jgi:putative serine protease PepD
MSEHDNDPRQQPSPSEADLSRPTVEIPRAEPGHPDSPGGQAGQPSQSSTGSGVPGRTSSPATADPAPAGADPATAAASPAPAAAGGPTVPARGPAEPVTQQQPVVPPPAAPVAPSPWHPAYQHSGWQGSANPGHGNAVPPQQPHLGAQPPLWAQPPAGAPAPGGAPVGRQGNRFGKLLAVGAAGLILMVGSGVAGGFAALAIDDRAPAVTKTYSAAPVVDGADLPKIAKAVENSVVSITAGNGEGSGVVLTADGLVLTNNHVVANAQGSALKVVFANGKSARATIVGTDPKTDLAVVKAEGVSDLMPAKFGDSDAMQVGDTVLALGSPLGLQGSVTAGIISATDRTIQTGGEGQQPDPFSRQSQAVTSISGLLQTDAPINPGNSGGALVNTRGEVIGINTAIATSGQSQGNIGVGFAIPSNKAKDVAAALRNGDKVSHPVLGIQVTGSDNGGAVVGMVTAGSPAERAGLQEGDVVTEFDGKAINDSDDLVAAVQSHKAGDQVELTYTRNGAEQRATVTLAETS